MEVKSNTNSMSEFLKLPFKRWNTLTGFVASGNYMIQPTALRNSTLLGSDPQFRFKCISPEESKTFHFITTKNAYGRAAVNWLLGKSSTQPIACNSFTKVSDDNSYSTQHCLDWGQGNKWGLSGVSVNDRYIDHTMWTYGKSHWNMFNNAYSKHRFECDNTRMLDTPIIKKGDRWRIFVR